MKSSYSCAFRYFLLVILTQLAACGTSALSSQDALDFRGVSLEEFLEKRFNDGAQSKFYGNTVRYSAFFNSSNSSQLSRPTTELSRFCTAGGGEFSALIRYTGDPVGRFFLNPTSEALSGAAHAIAIGRPDLAYTVASMVYNQSVRINNVFQSEATKSTYGKAAASGIYGTFECLYKERRGTYWRVNVLPIGFIPRDPNNHLIANELIVEISPLRK